LAAKRRWASKAASRRSFLELVVGTVQGQPLVQTAGGDPPGGSGDRAQRAQNPAGDEPADPGGGHRDDRQGDGAADQQLPHVVVDLPKSRLVSRALGLQKDGADSGVVRSFLKGGVDQRLNGDGVSSSRLLVETDAARLPGDAHRRQPLGEVHYVPVEQVDKGDHRRAACQERRAVQDSKAQPGGAAGQPQPARGTGTRAGSVHYGSPMR
jgi:hypothetical protein